MADNIKHDEIELTGIPTTCQYKNLSSNDDQLVNDENSDWLTESGNLPLWSRLKSTNSAGQKRGEVTGKEGNYEIEIPGRLLSLFGSIRHQTDCMNSMVNMKGYQLLSSVFALCSVLKKDFREWSENVLDIITSTAVTHYPELLNKLAIRDNELKISHLDQIYNFNGEEYKTQLQQAATGTLYIRYGLGEFNLARALPWFFSQYQFGLLECANRTLTFGRTLDTKYGFFMYDCQSHGHPLFEDKLTSSYILRTNHLQVLLYCLVTTLNVYKETRFALYNADVVILNPSERILLKKEEYVPTLKTPTKNVFKKTDSAISNKPTANNKILNKNSAKIFNSKTMKTPANNKKLILDPDKMYFLVAVPKKSGSISAKLESKKLLFSKALISENSENPPTDNIENVQVNIHRVKNQDDNELIQQGFSETIAWNKSASTETLTAEQAEATVVKKPTTKGLKVYLIDKSDDCGKKKSSTKNKIQIAHQLRDFFMKKT